MDSAGRTRRIEHASALGEWRMQVRAPDERLVAHVTRFHAYSERGTGPSRRREVPSGLATMVFNLGADLGVEFAGETQQVFGAGGAFFTGASARYAITETEHGQDGAQVMLTTLGARRLLGRPLEEVGDRLIDPVDLFGIEARDLIGRLQEANSQERRLALLEATIARRIGGSQPVADDLGWALGRLLDTSGRIAVAALAAEIGCSRKHLSQRFRREFGMPPKLFARTLRFARAVQALEAGRVESWAGLAAECGYADQAHLSRDFSEFAGSPPGAFLARRLPDDGGFRD